MSCEPNLSWFHPFEIIREVEPRQRSEWLLPSNGHLCCVSLDRTVPKAVLSCTTYPTYCNLRHSAPPCLRRFDGRTCYTIRPTGLVTAWDDWLGLRLIDIICRDCDSLPPLSVLSPTFLIPSASFLRSSLSGSPIVSTTSPCLMNDWPNLFFFSATQYTLKICWAATLPHSYVWFSRISWSCLDSYVWSLTFDPWSSRAYMGLRMFK